MSKFKTLTLILFFYLAPTVASSDNQRDPNVIENAYEHSYKNMTADEREAEKIKLEAEQKILNMQRKIFEIDLEKKRLEQETFRKKQDQFFEEPIRREQEQTQTNDIKPKTYSENSEQAAREKEIENTTAANLKENLANINKQSANEEKKERAEKRERDAEFDRQQMAKREMNTIKMCGLAGALTVAIIVGCMLIKKPKCNSYNNDYLPQEYEDEDYASRPTANRQRSY